ncbi:MAG: DUF5666 domain-containing protein [Myxococcales bacterium]|nr:DUF5666 domain-containing protein [Myxococcales bacterium]
MKARTIISLLSALALPAAAHEGGHDVRGIVTSVSGQELTVNTKKGAERFVVTPQTEFVKNGSRSAARELHESDRVVVHAKKKNGQMEAIKVQFATPKKQ